MLVSSCASSMHMCSRLVSLTHDHQGSRCDGHPKHPSHPTSPATRQPDREQTATRPPHRHGEIHSQARLRQGLCAVSLPMSCRLGQPWRQLASKMDRRSACSRLILFPQQLVGSSASKAAPCVLHNETGAGSMILQVAAFEELRPHRMRLSKFENC